MATIADTAVTAGQTAAADPGAGAGAAASPQSAPQSDEQILGIEMPESGPVAASGEDAQPGESKAGQQPAAAETKPQEQVPAPEAGEPAGIDLRTIPEKYRELVKSDPEIAGMFRDRAALAAQGIKIEELPALKAELDEVRAVDAKYFSGDPLQQQEVAAGMLAEDPQAFLGMFRAASQALAEHAPEQYGEITRELLSGTLRAAGFDEFAASARQAIASGDSAAAAALLREAVNWLGEQAKVGLPREEQLKLREAAIAQREQAGVEAQEQAERANLTRFQNEVWEQIGKERDAAIEQAVSKALPKEFPAEFRARIEREIREEVEKQMLADAQLQQERIPALYRAHVLPANFDARKRGARGLRFTDQGRQAFVRELGGTAKSLTGPAAAKILREWTGQFLAAQQDKSKAAAAAASRVDITGGNGAPPRAGRKLTPKDTRGMSDMEILDL